jgi:acyl carrier protein
MKPENSLRERIVGLFDGKSILKGIAADQDFFDVGASSLTIVDLQLQVEELLGVSIPTSTLMSNPTIDAWVQLYSQATELPRAATA